MPSEIRLSSNAYLVLEDNATMSDVEITSDDPTGQATIAELAEDARRHYAEVSIEASSWYSLIPDAIDAWEREQERLAHPCLVGRLRRAWGRLRRR
jgi:hypothetical protein